MKFTPFDSYPDKNKRYIELWGNYKSDKWKHSRLFYAEIETLLHTGLFHREDLIAIRDFVKNRDRHGKNFDKRKLVI
jgi:hypothetical protein